MIRILFLLLALAACGQPQWHKPGSSLATLEVDRADCQASARAAAKAASFSGNHVIKDVYGQSLAACLAKRGWSVETDTAPTAHAQAADPSPPPDGFALLSHTSQQRGALAESLFTYQRPDGASLMQIVQQTAHGRFADEPFPASPGMRLFDRGRLETLHGPARWALFFGQRPSGNWQAAFGARILSGKRQRLVISAALPMPAPKSAPPAGLASSPNQRKHLQRVQDELLAWLASQP